MKNLMAKRMKMSSLIVILFSLQFALFAQTQGDYITPIDIQSVNLNEIQKTKFERLEKNPEYKSLQFVEIGKLQDYIKNSELTFNIPGKGEEYVALVKEFEYTSPTEYVWKGDLIDQYGSIVVFCEKGNVFGHIVIENQEYEFQSFEDKTIFIEFDHEYLSKSKCGVKHKPDEIQSNHDLYDNGLNGKSCTGLVRILVLYTSAAQSSVSNIYNTATLAVNQVSDALNNSDVSWVDLHVVKASTAHLNFTENPDDYINDLFRLRNNTQAQQLRNQYQADLVVLLTDNVYPPIYGVAYIGPLEAGAYSIVEAPHATPNYTFAHEVGHLFGCLHEEDTNSPGVTGDYEFPHKFETGWWFWKKKWRTILQTNAWSSYTRIQNYSNPDVNHNNKATGTSTHDNARKLEEESCTVENFRPYNPPPSVYISGPSKGNNSGTYTWTAYGSGGQTPYTYLWKYSLDGTNYNGTFGTGQSVNGQLPLDNDLYLKVIMTDNNQQQAIDYFVTLNMSVHLGHKSGIISTYDDSTSSIKNSTVSLQTTNKEGFNMKTLYPNPAQSNTTVKYRLEHPGNVQMSIINSFGVVVQLHEIIHPSSGVFYKTLHTSKLEKGVYIVKISTGEEQKTQKLIIQ
jgi:hypothetical protein